jgi:hypothetical protein
LKKATQKLSYKVGHVILERSIVMCPIFLTYNSKQINVSELTRVCAMSRTTVYKYIEILEK